MSYVGNDKNMKNMDLTIEYNSFGFWTIPN